MRILSGRLGLGQVLALTAVLLALQTLPTEGRFIDPDGPQNALLDPLQETLDTLGIDVVRGHTADHMLDRTRPRVALLEGMATDVNPGLIEDAPWVQDFVAGRVAVLTAFHSPDDPSPVDDADAFTRRWNSVSKDRRVFLSFTRADLPYATVLAKELQEQGYVTFIYLNEAGSFRYPAETVGRLFADAGHHVVLDSLNARKSAGVWLEAKTAKVAAGQAVRYVPTRPSASDLNGTVLPPEVATYLGPRQRVAELRSDPIVLKRAGGIMFGSAAVPCKDIGDLSGWSLAYVASAEDGARLAIRTGSGQVPITGFSDHEIVSIAQFVEDGRPVIVNLKMPDRTSRCPEPPTPALRLVELHPAFEDTALGELMVRGDKLTWPSISGSAGYFGQVLDVESLPEALAERVFVMRTTLWIEATTTEARSFVANINDAMRPAAFCVNGAASLTGTPAIEVLAGDAEEVHSLDVSSRATELQGELFKRLDRPAYHAVLKVYRGSGLFHFFRDENPEGWSRFLTSLPDIPDAIPTPRVICPDCRAEDLVDWLALCRAVAR